MHNLIFYFIQGIFQFFKEIIIFPFWWYSYGLLDFLKTILNFIKEKEKDLALLAWIRNINKPLYDHYTQPWLILSLLVRSLQIIIKTIVLFLWLILTLIGLLLWLIAPIVICLDIAWQFFNL